jgi:hypothetical protein
MDGTSGQFVCTTCGARHGTLAALLDHLDDHVVRPVPDPDLADAAAERTPDPANE